MTADQQRTPAQQRFDEALRLADSVDSETAYDRAEEVAADLAALRGTVAAMQAGFMAIVETLNGRIDNANKRIDRNRALESPASAPRVTCSQCGGSGIDNRTEVEWSCDACGGNGRVASAPEPDPLCQCGHPKGHHHPYCHGNHDWMPSGCGCRGYVAQAEPATAHQEPPTLMDDINWICTALELTQETLGEDEPPHYQAIVIERLRAYGRDGAR
jgi:hypothetical protein